MIFDNRIRIHTEDTTTVPIGGMIFGQANKGIWWMPWHKKAMKDVVSCDKPRVGANNRQSGDFRMGQPSTGHAVLSPGEYIAWVKPTR